MSDYPNPNLHRADDVSGRGLLITLAVVVGLFLLLAAVGSVTSNGSSSAVGTDASATETAPAASTVTD